MKQGIRWSCCCLVLFVACSIPPKDNRPEETVVAMFEAAQKGRVDEYLACFTGNLRASLEKNADDMSEQAFREYLVSICEPVVGIAVSDVDPVKPGVVNVRVELVYRNKNEVQTCTLQEERGLWKITAMTAAQRIKTLIPYGQKVYEFAPDTTAGTVEQQTEPPMNVDERRE